MSQLDDILRLLDGLTTNDIRQVAAKCGLPWQTIYGIQIGKSQRPRIDTVEALLPALKRYRASLNRKMAKEDRRRALEPGHIVKKKRSTDCRIEGARPSRKTVQ